MTKLILILFILFTTNSFADSCSTYEIFYIPLDVEFYNPPYGLESRAFKKFSLTSCNIDKLMQELKKNNPTKDSDSALYRIKIKNNLKDEIYIDKIRLISWKNKYYPISKSLSSEVIGEIEDESLKHKAKNTAAEKLDTTPRKLKKEKYK